MRSSAAGSAKSQAQPGQEAGWKRHAERAGLSHLPAKMARAISRMCPALSGKKGVLDEQAGTEAGVHSIPKRDQEALRECQQASGLVRRVTFVQSGCE